MPKGKVATVPVDKDFFIAVVKARKSSLRRLGSIETPNVCCSEKTLRLALNNGGIRLQYAEQIARELDVDRDFLLGTPGVVPKKILDAGKDVKIRYASAKAKHHPHFSSIERASLETWDNTLKGFLTAFRISYDRQYLPLDTKQKYEFQWDMIDALIGVMEKHFPEDAYGNRRRNKYYALLAELESWYEELEIPRETFVGSYIGGESNEYDDFGKEFYGGEMPHKNH